MASATDDDEPLEEIEKIPSQGELEHKIGLWPMHRALVATFAIGMLLLVIFVGAALETLDFKSIQHQSTIPLSTFFDILKLGFAAVAGIGATVALVMAYRRQRVAEAAAELDRRIQWHAERVAAANAYDSAIRRITELYGRAVEQLGHEKAAVRLGGLYALELLATENSDQRQTIVDVICAYLRMPFNPPPDVIATMREPLADKGASSAIKKNDLINSVQELQVRRAAQAILQRHLDFRSEQFWADMDIDLSTATLVEFNLSNCRILGAKFWSTHFAGYTWFRNAEFVGNTDFGDSHFDGYATFEGARFRERAWFREVEIDGATEFGHTVFESEAYFASVKIRGHVTFQGAIFRYKIYYSAKNGSEIDFREARFHGEVRIDRESKETYDFTDALVEGGVVRWLPPGWAVQLDDPQKNLGRIVRKQRS